jgi:c-di-GMP-related signal transduction protein
MLQKKVEIQKDSSDGFLVTMFSLLNPSNILSSSSIDTVINNLTSFQN